MSIEKEKGHAVGQPSAEELAQAARKAREARLTLVMPTLNLVPGAYAAGVKATGDISDYGMDLRYRLPNPVIANERAQNASSELVSYGNGLRTRLPGASSPEQVGSATEEQKKAARAASSEKEKESAHAPTASTAMPISLQAAIPHRVRQAGEIAENDFIEAHAKLREMKAPPELEGAAIRGRELLKTEPERAAMILSLVEMFIENQSSIRPMRSVSALDGMAQVPNPAVMDSMGRLIALSARLADPSAKFGSSDLAALKAPGGEFSSLMAEQDGMRNASCGRSANALRMGSDKLAEAYSTQDIPSQMKSHIASAIKEARAVAERIERGGEKMPGDKEIADAASRLVLLSGMLREVSTIQNPQVKSDACSLLGKAYEMFRENGDSRYFSLMRLGIRELVSRGSTDTAFNSELQKGLNALYSHKNDEAKADADCIAVQNAIARKVASDLDKAASGLGTEMKQRISAISGNLRSSQSGIEGIMLGETALQIISGFKTASSLSADSRSGVDKIFSRAFDLALEKRNTEAAKAQLALADAYIGKSRTERDDIEGLSQMISQDPSLASHVGWFLGLDEAASGIRKAAGKIRNDEGRKSALLQIASDLERTRTDFARGNLLFSQEEFISTREMIRQDPARMQKVSALSAERGISEDEAVDVLSSMSLTLRVIQRGMDLGAIGNLILRLPQAKSESDKEIASILQMAANKVRSDDSAGARIFSDAARIYFETRGDKDRHGIIDLCKAVNGGRISQENAEEAFRIYKEKADQIGKIQDAKARNSASILFDLSLKAFENGDISGSRTLSDLGAVYASWASTGERGLGKEQKERRKEVMALAERTISSSSISIMKGETLESSLGGQDKLASLDKRIKEMDSDKSRLGIESRIEALNANASEKSWKPKKDEVEKKARSAKARGDDVAAAYYAQRAEDIDASLIGSGANAARKNLERYNSALSDAEKTVEEYEQAGRLYDSLLAQAAALEDQANANKGKPAEKALRESAAAKRSQAAEQRKVLERLSSRGNALMKEADRILQETETIVSGLEALDRNIRKCNTRHNELPISPLANAIRLSVAVGEGFDADYRGIVRTSAGAPGEVAVIPGAGGEKAKAYEGAKPTEAPVRLDPGSARLAELHALEQATYKVGHAEARKQENIQNTIESGIRNSKEQILDIAVSSSRSQIRSMLADYSMNASVRQWALNEAKTRGVLDPEAAVERYIDERKGGYQTRLNAAMRSGNTKELRSLLQEVARDMGIKVAAPAEKPEDMKGPGIVLDPQRDGTEAFEAARNLWYSGNYSAAGAYTKRANSNVRSLGILSNIAITDMRLNQNHNAIIDAGRESNFIYGSAWARDPENYSSPAVLGQVIEYVKDDAKRDDLRKRLAKAEELGKDPSKAAEAKAIRSQILRDLSSMGQGAIEGNVSQTTRMPLTLGIDGIVQGIANGSLAYWDANKRWNEGIGIRSFSGQGGSAKSANAMLDNLEANIDKDASRQEADTQRIGYVFAAHKEATEAERERAKYKPGTPAWDNNAPTWWEAGITKHIINRGIGVANFIPGIVNIALPKRYTIPKIETFEGMDAETKYKHEKREAERIEHQYTPILSNMRSQSALAVNKDIEAGHGLSDSIHAIGRSGRFYMSEDFQASMIDSLPENVRSRYSERLGKAYQITDKEQRALEIDRIWRDAAASHGSLMVDVVKGFAAQERMSDDEFIQVRGRIVCAGTDRNNSEWRTAKERMRRQLFIANVTDSKLQAMERDPDVESNTEKRYLRDGLLRMRDEALGTANAIARDPHNLPSDSAWWNIQSNRKQNKEFFQVLLRDSNISGNDKERISQALSQMHTDMDLLIGGRRQLQDGSFADVRMSQSEWEMASRAYEQFSMLETDLISRLANPGYQATAASDLNQITALQTRLAKFREAAFSVADSSGKTVEERAAALRNAEERFSEGVPKVREGFEYKEKDRRTLDAYSSADKTIANKTSAAELAETTITVAGFASGGAAALITGSYLAMGKIKEAGEVYREAGSYGEMSKLEVLDASLNVAIGIAMFAGPVLGSITKGFAEESSLARMSGNTPAALRYERLAERTGAVGSVVGHALVIDGATSALASLPQALEEFSEGRSSIFALVARTYSAGVMIVPGLHTLSEIRKGGVSAPRHISKPEYVLRAAFGENPWHLRDANIEAGQAKRAQDIASLESSPEMYAAHLENVRDAVNNGKPVPPLTSEAAVRDAALVDSVAANKATARNQSRPGTLLGEPVTPTQKDIQDAAREVAQAAPAMRRIRQASYEKDSPVAQEVKKNADIIQSRAEIGDSILPAEDRGKNPLSDRKNAEDRAIYLLAREAESRSSVESHSKRIETVIAGLHGKVPVEATVSEVAEARLAIELSKQNNCDIKTAANDIAKIYAAGGEEILNGISDAIRTRSGLRAAKEGKEGDVSTKELGSAFAWLGVVRKAMAEHPDFFSSAFKNGVESLHKDLTLMAKEIGFNLEESLVKEIDGNATTTASSLHGLLSSAAIGVIPQREGGPVVARGPGQDGDIVIIESADYAAAKARVRERERNAKDEKDPDFNLSRDEFKFSKAIREELVNSGYRVGENTIVQIGEGESGSSFDTVRANNTIVKKANDKAKGSVATKNDGYTLFDALNSDSKKAIEYAGSIFGSHSTQDFGFMMTDKGKTWMMNVFRDFGDLAMLFYFKATAELSAEFGPEAVVKLAASGSDEVVIVMSAPVAERYVSKHGPEFFQSIARKSPAEFEEYARGKNNGSVPTDPAARARLEEDFGRERFNKMENTARDRMKIEFTLDRYGDGLRDKMTGFAEGAGFKPGSAIYEGFSATSTERTAATVTVDVDQRGGTKKVTYRRGNREYENLEIMLNNTETRKMIDRAEAATKDPTSNQVWAPYASKDPSQRVRKDIENATPAERDSIIATLKIMARLDRGRKNETVPRIPDNVRPDMVFAVRAIEFQDTGLSAFRLMALMAGKGAHNVEEQILGPSTINLFGHGCADAFDLFALNLRDALSLAGVKRTDVEVYKAGGMGYAVKFRENLTEKQKASLQNIVLQCVKISKEKTYNDLQQAWSEAKAASKGPDKENAPDRLPFQGLNVYYGANRDAIERMMDGDMFYGRSSRGRGNQMPGDLNHAMRIGLTIGHLAGDRAPQIFGPVWTGVRLPSWARQPSDFRSIGKEEQHGMILLDSALRYGLRRAPAQVQAPVQAPQPARKAREGAEPGGTLRQGKPAVKEAQEAIPLQRTGTDDHAAPPTQRPAQREGEPQQRPVQTSAPQTKTDETATPRVYGSAGWFGSHVRGVNQGTLDNVNSAGLLMLPADVVAPLDREGGRSGKIVLDMHPWESSHPVIDKAVEFVSGIIFTVVRDGDRLKLELDRNETRWPDAMGVEGLGYRDGKYVAEKPIINDPSGQRQYKARQEVAARLNRIQQDLDSISRAKPKAPAPAAPATSSPQEARSERPEAPQTAVETTVIPSVRRTTVGGFEVKVGLESGGKPVWLAASEPKAVIEGNSAHVQVSVQLPDASSIDLRIPIQKSNALSWRNDETFLKDLSTAVNDAALMQGTMWWPMIQNLAATMGFSNAIAEVKIRAVNANSVAIWATTEEPGASIRIPDADRKAIRELREDPAFRRAPADVQARMAYDKLYGNAGAVEAPKPVEPPAQKPVAPQEAGQAQNKQVIQTPGGAVTVSTVLTDNGRPMIVGTPQALSTPHHMVDVTLTDGSVYGMEIPVEKMKDGSANKVISTLPEVVSDPERRNRVENRAKEVGLFNALQEEGRRPQSQIVAPAPMEVPDELTSIGIGPADLSKMGVTSIRYTFVETQDGIEHQFDFTAAGKAFSFSVKNVGSKNLVLDRISALLKPPTIETLQENNQMSTASFQKLLNLRLPIGEGPHDYSNVVLVRQAALDLFSIVRMAQNEDQAFALGMNRSSGNKDRAGAYRDAYKRLKDSDSLKDPEKVIGEAKSIVWEEQSSRRKRSQEESQPKEEAAPVPMERRTEAQQKPQEQVPVPANFMFPRVQIEENLNAAAGKGIRVKPIDDPTINGILSEIEKTEKAVVYFKDGAISLVKTKGSTAYEIERDNDGYLKVKQDGKPVSANDPVGVIFNDVVFERKPPEPTGGPAPGGGGPTNRGPGVGGGVGGEVRPIRGARAEKETGPVAAVSISGVDAYVSGAAIENGSVKMSVFLIDAAAQGKIDAVRSMVPSQDKEAHQALDSLEAAAAARSSAKGAGAKASADRVLRSAASRAALKVNVHIELEVAGEQAAQETGTGGRRAQTRFRVIASAKEVNAATVVPGIAEGRAAQPASQARARLGEPGGTLRQAPVAETSQDIETTYMSSVGILAANGIIVGRTDLNGGIEAGGSSLVKITIGASGVEFQVETKSTSERDSVVLAIAQLSKVISQGRDPLEIVNAWIEKTAKEAPTNAELKGTQVVLFSLAFSNVDEQALPPAYRDAIGKIRNEYGLATALGSQNPNGILTNAISEEAGGIQRQRVWLDDYHASGGRLPADPAAWKRLDAGYIEMLNILDGNPGMSLQSAASSAFHGTEREIHFSMGQAYNFPDLLYTRHDDVQLKVRIGKNRELEPGMQLTREGAESAAKDAMHDVALARLLVNRYIAGTATAAEAKAVESVYGVGAKAFYGKGLGSVNLLQDNTLMNSTLIALDQIGAGSRSSPPAAQPQQQAASVRAAQTQIAPAQEAPISAPQSPAQATSPGANMSFRFTLSEYDRAEEISANLSNPNKAIANGVDRGIAEVLRTDKNLPPPGDARTDYILRKMRENETSLTLDQLGARGVLRFEKTGGEMDPDLPVMLPPTYTFIVSTSWGNVKVKVDGNLEGENLLKAIDQETSKQKKSLAAFKMSQAENMFRQRLGVPMRQDIELRERDSSKPLNKALSDAAPMPQGHKPRETSLAEGWDNQRARSGMVKIVGGDLDFILANAWDSRTNSIDEGMARSILNQRTPKDNQEYAVLYANALIEAANRIGKEREPGKIAKESVGIVDDILLPRQPPGGGGPGQGPRGPGGRGPATEGPAEQGGARVIPIGAARGAKASAVASFDDARSFVEGASKEDLDSLGRADPSLRPQIEAIDRSRSEAAKKIARNSLALMVSNRIERGVLRIERSESQGQMDGTTYQPTMITTYRVVAEEGGQAQEGAAARPTPQEQASGSVSVRPNAPRPSDVRELRGPRPAAPSEKPAEVKDIFELRHLFGSRTGNQELEAAIPKGMDTNSLKISRTARALDRIASRTGPVELPPDIQQAVDRIRTEKDKAKASGRKGDLERVAFLTVEYATRLVNAEVQAARSASTPSEVINDRTIAAKIEKAHGSADMVAALSSLSPIERFAYDLALARARQNGRTQPISPDFSNAAVDAMAWHNKKENTFSVATFKGVPLSSDVTGALHIDISVLAKDGNTAYIVRVSGDKVEIIDITGMKFRNDAEKEAFIRYANFRMADFSKSFGSYKEVSDSLQKIMEYVRNGNMGTALRFAKDLGDAVAGSKARTEASRPADPEAAFRILSRENIAPIPPQKAQAFRDFTRMDADDKVMLIEMLLDAAKAEERKGPGAANADLITRLRTYASHLTALRTLNGETGLLLEKALGLRPGQLSAIYLNPAISDPHSEFFKAVQNSGLISISGEGADVHVYPGLKLKDILIGLMTSNTGNLILTLLKMYPDASKIEMTRAGGISGVTKVRITDGRGKHFEYIKPVDLQAAATGDENLQRAWVPTADTMTRTPDQKEDLAFRLPNGSRSRYGISRSITNSRIEIAGVTLETAFTTNIVDIKNNPEILKALGQHGDAFLEQLWFYLTASLSSGAIDGHECNTFAMLMKVTNGNAKELRDRGFHFIPDGHGGEFVIMFGRIDTDDSAGSYWVGTDRHGRTDISSHIERSGGRAYLYRLMKEFVVQWNEAHAGSPPITMEELSDKMFRQPVTGPGGAVSEPPAIAGSRRWMRIRGNDPAYTQAMEDGFRKNSGNSVGVSFGLTDQAAIEQFGTYGVTRSGHPGNGEPWQLIADQTGRTIAVAEYESLSTNEEQVYRHLPKNRWSYIIEEIDMPPGADRSHANGTFQFGGKTFLSYSSIGDIPQESRDKAYSIHVHPNVNDNASLDAGGMALWIVPRKIPGASGTLRVTESLGIQDYPMRGTIPSFRVMISGGEVGAANRAMRLGQELDKTIANTPSTP